MADAKAYINIEAILPALEAGTVILTPSLRAARQVRLAWSAHQLELNAIAPPAKAYPVEAWLEKCWQEAVDRGHLSAKRLLNRLQEGVIWREIVDSNTAEFSLLHPSAASKSAMRTRDQLLRYCIDIASSETAGHFDADPDCRAFQVWLDAFNDKIDRHGWCCRADVFSSLLTHSPVTKPSVILFHCQELLPLDRKAIEHLAEEVIEINATHSGHATALNAICYPDQKAELAGAAKWAATRHRENRGSSAIILLDMQGSKHQLEYFLRAEFDCLDREYNRLPVNFSKGAQLIDAPLYRDWMLALEFSQRPISRAELVAIFRSPYFRPVADAGRLTDDAIILQLIDRLFALGTEAFTALQVRLMLRKLAPEHALLKTLEMVAQLTASPRQAEISLWVERIKEVTKLWGWPGRPALDSLEYQQAQRFNDVLDDLLMLDEFYPKLSISKILSLLRTALEDRVFQPKTQSGDVQVLALQEALALTFDEVLIVGANSTAMPESLESFPFIPLTVQRAAGIVGSSLNDDFHLATQTLKSLQYTHGSVHASWAGMIDGVEMTRSPMISHSQPATNAIEETIERWRQKLPEQSLESIADHQASEKPLDPSVEERGGVSILADQSACPFKAWARHRRQLRALQSIQFGLSAGEHGSVVHSALMVVWNALGSSEKLAATQLEDRQNLCAMAAEAALSSLSEEIRERVGAVCLQTERELLISLLLEWLSAEDGRSIAFSVAEAETDTTLTIGDLSIRGRIDRVDRLADGRTVVIDYKTGGSKSEAGWLSERIPEPQLPIYALQTGDVAGIAWARVRPGEVEFIPLGEQLGLHEKKSSIAEQTKRLFVEPPSWDDIKSMWSEELHGLVDEFATGYASVTPQTRACDYCDFKPICRIALDANELEESVNE